MNEQSGIKASDGGFQVAVANNTTLTGGATTSTQQAVHEQRNDFRTGGDLTLSDIDNHASNSAKSVGVNVGSGFNAQGKLAPQATSTGIGRIFDADKVQQEINAQVQIIQTSGQEADKAIDQYIDSQRKTLGEQIKNAKTEEERKQAEHALKDVNMQERALNVLVGAHSGMAGSVVTKEVLSGSRADAELDDRGFSYLRRRGRQGRQSLVQQQQWRQCGREWGWSENRRNAGGFG